MDPRGFARAMRSRGWRGMRVRRGLWMFGIRFPNGFGVTRVVSLDVVSRSAIAAADLADYVTGDAALGARYDLRQAVR